VGLNGGMEICLTLGPTTTAKLAPAQSIYSPRMLRYPGGDAAASRTTGRERDRCALRDPERKIEAWSGRLAETDRLRVAYQRQQAEVLMTLEELRAHLGELDRRRAEAESELVALRDTERRLDELRAYSELIEEHLRGLPLLVQGRDGAIRDHAYTDEHEERTRAAREEGRLPVFPLSPDLFRERTP
jgi:hypothetical protein